MDVSFTVSVLFFHKIVDVENRLKIRVSSFDFERCVIDQLCNSSGVVLLVFHDNFYSRCKILTWKLDRNHI